MDFTILAVVLLLCGGIPLRNKIYKEHKKKKEDKKERYIKWVISWIVFYVFLP